VREAGPETIPKDENAYHPEGLLASAFALVALASARYVLRGDNLGAHSRVGAAFLPH
jgi:hypothetical protein